ncbi:hypothetical protein PSYMP_27138 [Pseudomonas amygdali pv. morsprunorum str. M302280]|nr:hypothetical protein PSYMP_27138 [Pseudomonas amygdali pv. morsprunorum str. M302280]
MKQDENATNKPTPTDCWLPKIPDYGVYQVMLERQHQELDAGIELVYLATQFQQLLADLDLTACEALHQLLLCLPVHFVSPLCWLS